MPYTYRYIPAAMSVKPKAGTTPKDTYVDLFQETLKEQFYNSSDWWSIEEENVLGTKIFTPVDVRMAHVINAETGLKLGDDWKTLLFKEIDHAIDLGKMYRFDNSVWITVNTEKIKNLTGTCTIRRCNNTLRWIDEPTGAYYEEPCAIEYLVKEPRDYFTQGSPFTTPGGFLHIEMQFNEISNKITENQRFLFGNPNHWTCYKVIGTGLNDFRNAETFDKNSAKILTVDLIANFVNKELDDIVNGIADVYTNVYTLTLNKTHVEGSISGTSQLIPFVTYNENSVTREIVWTSSSSAIASVNTNGLVTFNATGSCVITANIKSNPTSASCTIVVSASPLANVDVIFNPDTNYVLEGATKTYSVYLYSNDVPLANTFAISCNPNGVPITSFSFNQTDGNHFTLKNIKKDVLSHLTIQCTSGSYSESKDIFLRGAW